MSAGSSRLTFDASPGLPVDQLSAALPGGATAREPMPGHYVVDGVADATTVAAVTAWCADRGVLPKRLDTGQRSLEDVFLALTSGST